MDTGPLVAAAVTDDDHHHACVELVTLFHLAEPPLLVSPLVVAKVSYLLQREAGSHAVAEFLRSLRDGDLVLADLIPSDLDRMAHLVERYADLPLDATDASAVAFAERMGTAEVATPIAGTSAPTSSAVGALTLLS